MRGQFLVISAIVVALILLTAASTISEIRGSEFEPSTVDRQVQDVKEAADKIDPSKKEERRVLARTLSQRKLNVRTRLNNSGNCLETTLVTDEGRLELGCLGAKPGAGAPTTFSLLLELVTDAEFITEGNFDGTSVSRKEAPGGLGIGYRNGTSKFGNPNWRTEGGTGFQNVTASANLGSAVGDGATVLFDGDMDGLVDVLFTDFDSTSKPDPQALNLRQNTGGNFVDNTSEIDAGGTRGAGAGDYDNDNDTDLIIGFGEFLNVNQGGFSFTSRDVTPDTNLESIMFSDVNRDGNLDIYAPGSNLFGVDEQVLWYENQTGSFAARDQIDGKGESNIENTEGATTADINSDGFPDYLYTVPSDNPSVTRIFLSDGPSSFDYYSDASDPRFGDFPNDIGPLENSSWVWGDYNDDGHIDLFLASTEGEGLYKNDGAGRFTEVTSEANVSVQNPDGADWGDFNNDGDLDLIVSKQGGVSTIYENTGDGSFVNKSSTENLDAANSLGDTPGFFDYDNDGDLDVLSNDPVKMWKNREDDDNYLRVYARGNATKSDGSPLTPLGAQIYVEDAKNRLVGYREVQSSFGKLQPPQRQHFGLDDDDVYDINVWFPSSQTWTNYTNVEPDNESIVLKGNTLENTVWIKETANDASISKGSEEDKFFGYWRFDRKPTTSNADKSVNDWWTSGFTPDINIRRMDTSVDTGSGASTEVTLEASSSPVGSWNVNVSLYDLQNNSESWNDEIVYSTKGTMEGIVPADLDNDNRSEIVIPEEKNPDQPNGTRVAFFESGTWNVELLPGSQKVESASVGDIDQDGDLDIVAGGNDDFVYFYENDAGTGKSWTRHTLDEFTTGVDSLRSVALGDVDDDNDLDVVGTGFHGTVFWLENDGSDSNWNRNTVGSVTGNGWHVLVADLDSDSDLDIISGDDEELVLWKNDGSSNPSFNKVVIDSQTSGERFFTSSVLDVDDDGDLDIISGTDQPRARLYTSDGNWNSWNTSTLYQDTGTDIRSIQNFDVNFDGRTDLVIGRNADLSDPDESPMWLRNDGTDSNWEKNKLGSVTDPGHYGISVVDIDRDGVQEILSGEDAGSGGYATNRSELRVWDRGVEAKYLDSKTVSFSNDDPGSRTTTLTWNPNKTSYNLVAEADSERKYTQVLSMNDETAAPNNAREIQQVFSQVPVQDYSGQENDGRNEKARRNTRGIFNTSGVELSNKNVENWFGAEYVDLGENIDFSGDEMTISSWAYLENMTDDPRIISKATGTANSEHYFMLGLKDSSQREITFRLRTDGSVTQLDSTDSINFDEWTHLVARYDGSKMQIFMNGTEIGSTPKTGEIDANRSVQTLIGAQPKGCCSDDPHPWHGKLDEVQLYDRTLSNGEIRDLYFDGISKPFNSSYSVTGLSVPSGRNVSKIEVNSSVPSPVTEAEVEVTHSSGSTDSFTLDKGRTKRNYSVGITNTGGSVDVDFRFRSSDPEITPQVDTVRIYASN